MSDAKTESAYDGATRMRTATPRSSAPVCFVELQRNGDWWKAKPEGSRLVGLVVARDDMPSILQQREDLSAFGVQILDFKFPAPETLETWEQRLGRLFGTLRAGDVLVVANERALGQTAEEVSRTIQTLRRHNLVVKVLSHGARHLVDAPVK